MADLRRVVIGSFASVVLIMRLQFGARLLQDELVGSELCFDIGGRVWVGLLGSSGQWTSTTKVKPPRLFRAPTQ